MGQSEAPLTRRPSETLAPPAESPVRPRPPVAIRRAPRTHRSRSATVPGLVRASALETIGEHAGCRALRRGRGSSQQRNGKPDSDHQHRARGRTRNTGQDCPAIPTQASSLLPGRHLSCGTETFPTSRSRSRMCHAAPRSDDLAALASRRCLQPSSRRLRQQVSCPRPQVHWLDEPAPASN